MTNILIFYPHNPANPQHGSHLRALQQIRGLLEIGQIYLASTNHTSDTKWPMDLDAVTEKLGVAGISIFERSVWGKINKVWSLVRVLKRIGWRHSTDLRIRGQRWLMQQWFHRLASAHRADLIVVNYTRWAWLVEQINRRVPRVIELHDLISVNQYLQQTINVQLIITDETVKLSPHQQSTGYVTTIKQLPKEVLERLKIELADIGRFNLVWSIADSESNLIRETDASIQIDTILPDVGPGELKYDAQGYALLPTGPNVFNTYSLLKFIQEIEPWIAFPDNAKILITGKSWRHLQFDRPRRVEYLGMVDQYQKVLGSARFVIVPTAVGTGQQIKIFEALGNGVPVVCYRVAVPESINSHDNGVAGVDTAQEFAEAVGRMWSDEAFYQRLLLGAKEFSVRNGQGPNAYVQSVDKLLANLT